MDINKYRIYIRDVDLSDDDLSLIMQDVINDISISTEVFKKLFSFNIDSDTYIYNIEALFDINEATRQNISDIQIQGLDHDELLGFLKDPNEINQSVNITKTDNQYYDSYYHTQDILVQLDKNKDNSSFVSIFNRFTDIGNGKYKLNTKVESNRNVLCIVSIIPDINNIDDKIEMLIKPAIIEGIRYFSGASNSAANEQVRYNNWLRYQKAKLAFLNKFPVSISEQRISSKFERSRYNMIGDVL